MKNDVRSQIEKSGIVSCARVTLPEQAVFAAGTLFETGIPIVEFTLTLPEAPNAIEQLANLFRGLVVGASTVLDENSARRSVDAGARFLTNPRFVPEVVAYAKKTDSAAFSGALTATEIIAAWNACSEVVKIFPTATIWALIEFAHSTCKPSPWRTRTPS
jgi:2-dehydro-3-deoxyphosphogluconate aldolase/(4S)-4-hydroxy-2-oxoglutarate aldolase